MLGAMFGGSPRKPDPDDGKVSFVTFEPAQEGRIAKIVLYGGTDFYIHDKTEAGLIEKIHKALIEYGVVDPAERAARRKAVKS